MKILYVEDQLSENIPKIIGLFSELMEKENIAKLNELEHDKSGYGAESQEIKEIVEFSGVIEVEYKFSAALEKVMNNYQKYSLFIIDRNLSSEDYNTKLITEIDSAFDDKLFNKYREREGDYLLHKLITKGIDIGSQFYFLTAYTSSELQNAEEIFGLIERKTFKKNNIIEKGNSESTRELINKINNIDIVNLQLENKEFIEILRSKIGERASDKYIHLLSKKDSEDFNMISDNLLSIRIILDNILTNFAENFSAPEWCWNKKNKTQIVIKSAIAWINPFDRETKKYNYNYNSNSIIRNFMYGIHDIASDFAAHENLKDCKEMIKSTGYQPTVNTVNALIFELKDIILWFGDLLGK